MKRMGRSSVFFEHRLAFRQARGNFFQQLIQLLVLAGADRHHGAKRMQRHDLGNEGEEIITILHLVDLRDDQNRALRVGQQRQQLGVAFRPLAGLDHMHHHVDVGQGLRHDAVHHAVHGAAMARLETGGINEDELLVFARQHAMDAMARGLRLARHDGDLGTDQGVGQRGLAHIGAANDGNKAGTKRGIAHLVS
jgi:hypothetical protein